MDGIAEDEVLNHSERIKIYPVQIGPEDDLVFWVTCDEKKPGHWSASICFFGTCPGIDLQ